MGNARSVPVTLDSYFSFLLPDEANLVKTLTQKKAFDIQSKIDKIVDRIGAIELTGQTSVVSDQGTELTCVSHAIGKAIVEIIDGFNMDCDQKNIIQELIKTVQPGCQPSYISEFSNESIEVKPVNSKLRSPPWAGRAEQADIFDFPH